MRTRVPLRAVLAERGLPPQHAQDLLAAFRLDVTKLRYRDWDDLIDYCALFAMPVGRFVLDVHGESRGGLAGQSDALCAALQIINHLQDCKDDYRNLDRVYIPLDALAASGARVEELGAARASPALLDCLQRPCRAHRTLLERERRLCRGRSPTRGSAWKSPSSTRWRSGSTRLLQARDPLSERVHLTRAAVAGVTLVGVLRGACRGGCGRRFAAAAQKPRGA